MLADEGTVDDDVDATMEDELAPAAEDDCIIEDETLEDWLRGEDVEDDRTDEDMPLQFPNPGWQPVPQYAEVEPLYKRT